MALQFKMWTPTESNLTELGTVASQIRGGKIKFTPGSLAKYQAGQIKAISILLTNKKGESTTAPLSKRVSATMKSALANGSTKQDCLSAILKLQLLETEDGANIISAPRGASGEEEEVSVESGAKSQTTYEDILATAVF
jgi:hypothetical protein